MKYVSSPLYLSVTLLEHTLVTVNLTVSPAWLGVLQGLVQTPLGASEWVMEEGPEGCPWTLVPASGALLSPSASQWPQTSKLCFVVSFCCGVSALQQLILTESLSRTEPLLL